MHFIGLGLHVLIALFFAVHVVRRGHPMYWLIVLFSFPLLGSIVYFVAMYLPGSRLSHGANRAAGAAVKVIHPTKALRQARLACDQAPTPDNRMRLAQALLEAGHPSDAAVSFESALNGIHGDDPDIRYSAARAWFESGEVARAVEHLDWLKQHRPDYRPEEVALRHAQSLAAEGRIDEARNAFIAANERFGTFESLVEYTIFSLRQGERESATRLRADINRAMSRWNRANRDINKALLRRLRQAEQDARS
ncbi:MAG: hypothetical protein R3F22_01540 [Lysobacteraceae bacterium]